MTRVIPHADTAAVLSDGRNVTKAAVRTLTWQGRKAVIKTYTHRPWLVRRVLGPLMLSREERALRRLEEADVAGVPRCLARPRAAEIVLSRLAGRPLRDLRRAGEHPPAGFFAALDGLLARIHQAGVAQCDIGPGDVLVQPDGAPALLDFSVSVVRGRGILGRVAYGLAVSQDRRRRGRLAKHFVPASRSAPEAPARRSAALGRLRLAAMAALLGFWAMAGEPGVLDFLVGLPAVIAGSAVRVRAAGYLLKTTRLATAGPYARCRHPLYLGRLLLFTGLAVMARLPGNAHLLILAAGLGVFFLYYLPRKKRVEGARLEQVHGEAYRRYRDAVPALWPRRRAWPGADAGGRWRLARFLRNRELLMLLLEGGLLTLMAWRALA